MSEKEPGQLAFEAYFAENASWAHASEGHKAKWAAVEAAIRQDEREKDALTALRCAVSRDADCRNLQEHIAAAIRQGGKE